MPGDDMAKRKPGTFRAGNAHQKFILAAHRILGLPLIATFFGFAFFGMWMIGVDRLRDEDLKARMTAYARILTISTNDFTAGPETGPAGDPLRPILADYFAATARTGTNEFPGWYDQTVRPHCGTVRVLTGAGTREEFPGIASIVSNLVFHQPDSHRFKRATVEAHHVLPELTAPGIFVPAPRAPRCWPDARIWFTNQGIAPQLPMGLASGYRDEARRYLENRDAFTAGAPLQCPASYLLRPWRMFAFYDPARSHHSDSIPAALALLLVALSLALDTAFRGVILKAPLTNTRAHVNPLGDRAIWSTGKRGVFARMMEVAAPWTRAWIWIACAGIALGLYIELFLNIPVRPMEWVFNVPIMIVTAAATMSFYFVLWHMGSCRLSPSFLRRSAGDQRTILRPLVIAAVVLTACSLYIAAEGLLMIRLNQSGGWPRGLAQIALGSIMIALIGRCALRIQIALLRRRAVAQNRRNASSAAASARPLDPDPDRDARLDLSLIKALLIAILPAPAIIEAVVDKLLQ